MIQKLEEFLGVQPIYSSGEVFGPRAEGGEPAAILAIGDEALRLKVENRYSVQMDLAEFWNSRTGLPFVFAVCAVREDFLQTAADTAREIRETFLDCRRQGLQRLPEICDRVARRIPMDCEACSLYLRAMQYDLGPAKQQALEKFFTLLIQRGEADMAALPLKIFS